MSQQRKYKFIAAFLLVVFSLNTLAGFACSIGINLGYNSKHHEHQKNDHDKANKHRSHQMDCHSNQDAPDIKISGVNDDCCANQVNSFALLDKSVAYNYLLLPAPLLSIATVINSFISDKDEPGYRFNSGFQFVRRSCSLDDTDIRIAIQSFQI